MFVCLWVQLVHSMYAWLKVKVGTPPLPSPPYDVSEACRTSSPAQPLQKQWRLEWAPLNHLEWSRNKGCKINNVLTVIRQPIDYVWPLPHLRQPLFNNSTRALTTPRLKYPPLYLVYFWGGRGVVSLKPKVCNISPGVIYRLSLSGTTLRGAWGTLTYHTRDLYNLPT